MAFDEKSAALEIARLRDALHQAEERITSLERQLAEALSALEEARRGAARQAAPFRREQKQKVADEKRKKSGRKPGHRGSAPSLSTSIRRLKCRCPTVQNAAAKFLIEDLWCNGSKRFRRSVPWSRG